MLARGGRLRTRGKVLDTRERQQVEEKIEDAVAVVVGDSPRPERDTLAEIDENIHDLFL